MAFALSTLSIEPEENIIQVPKSKLFKLSPVPMPETPEESAPTGPFDPEGAGYDYDTATAVGDKPDAEGHWHSLDPNTGMVLKGKKHPTWDKTIQAEEILGNKVIKKEDGRYYSVPKEGTPERTLGRSIKNALSNVFIKAPLEGMAYIVKGLAATIKDVWGRIETEGETDNVLEAAAKLAAWHANNLNKLAEKAPKVTQPGFEKGPVAFLEKAATGFSQSAAPMVAQYYAPILGAGLIYAQIKGAKYEELVQQGIDPDRANTAADISALMGTPIEFAGNLLGFRGAGDAFLGIVAKSGMSKKLGLVFLGLAESGAGEGSENVGQAITDVIAEEYGKGVDKSAGEIVANVKKRWTSKEFWKDAFYQGALGATGGIMLGGGGMIAGAATGAMEKVAEKMVPEGRFALSRIVVEEKIPEREAITVAKDLGIKYDGMQIDMGPQGETWPQWTDSETGTSFHTPTVDRDTVTARLKEIREKFTVGKATSAIKREFGVNILQGIEKSRGLTGKDIDVILLTDDLSKVEGKELLSTSLSSYTGKPIDIFVTDGNRILTGEQISPQLIRFTETPSVLKGKKLKLSDQTKTQLTKGVSEAKLARIAQPGAREEAERPLPHAVPEQVIAHYTPVPNVLNVIKGTGLEEMRRDSKYKQEHVYRATPEWPFIKYSDWYGKDVTPETIRQGFQRYEGKVPAGKVYDFTKDPLGFEKQANTIIEKSNEPLPDFVNVLNKLIKDAGYLGYMYKSSAGNNWFAMFGEIPVKPATKVVPITQKDQRHIKRIKEAIAKGYLKKGMPEYEQAVKRYPEVLELEQIAKSVYDKAIVGNNDLYTIFDKKIKSGPLDGGCWAMATSLQRLFGGELYTLYNGKSGTAEHIVLKHGDEYWDADGQSTKAELLSRWEIEEDIADPQLRIYKEGDVLDSPRDETLVTAVMKHIQGFIKPVTKVSKITLEKLEQTATFQRMSSERQEIWLTGLAQPDAVKVLQKIPEWLKQINVPQSLIDKIQWQPVPQIMRSADVTYSKSEEMWKAELGENYDKSLIAAMTYLEQRGDTILPIVQLSMAIPDMQKMEATVFHEYAHIAFRTFLPDLDYNRMMEHFQGNEESAAEAFRKFVMDPKSELSMKQPNWLRTLWATVQRYLTRINEKITGMNLRGVQDIFKDLQAGLYFERKIQLNKQVRQERVKLPEVMKNKNFQKWFKGSKVVDEKGNPKVMYHGTVTRKAFDKFLPLSHFGTVWAAEDRLHSRAGRVDKVIYEGLDWEELKPLRGERIIPVYLSIKYPLEVTDEGGDWYPSTIATGLWDQGRITEEQYNIFSKGDYDTKGFDNLLQFLEDAGYDGLTYVNAGEDPGSRSYVPFYPEQIKSVFNRGTWDRNDPRISFMRIPAPRVSQPAPTFYSALAKAVTDRFTEMPAKVLSLRNWLEKVAKPAELKWMGTDLWLEENKDKEGKIDKTKFAQWVQDNQVRVEEITKTDMSTPAYVVEYLPDEKMYVVQADTGDIVEDNFATEEEAERYITMNLGRVEDWEGTKFSQWQLPGPAEDYTELVFVDPTLINDGYRSTHYPDIAGYNGHVRFNTRTDAEGKRVLFVEEVQNDRHQTGKKEGYVLTERERKENDKRIVEAIRPIQKELAKELVALDNLGFDTTDEAFHAIEQNSDFATRWEIPTRVAIIAHDYRNLAMERIKGLEKVPPAPFAKNWPEVTMKRMLRYAADHGYDKIAWTTGAQQADRYDLRKQIDSIGYRMRKGLYEIRAIQGLDTRIQKTVAKEELPGLVGKDIAAKIIAGEGRRVETGETFLEGIDLAVGGEGMVSFYDELIPGFMRKYVKQWGGKVEKTAVTVKLEYAPKFNATYDFDRVYQDVHSVSLTPEMTESVITRGQAWFSMIKSARHGNDKFNVGLKQSAIRELMTDLGIAGLDSKERRHDAAVLREAWDTGLKDKALDKATAVLANPTPLSDVDTMGMGLKLVEMKRQHKRSTGELRGAFEQGDEETIQTKTAELDRLEAEFKIIGDAVDISGSEKGRTLRAQRWVLDEDYDLLSVATRAVRAKGKPLTPDERSKLEQAVNKHEKASDTVKAATSRDKATQASKILKSANLGRYKTMTKEAKDAELRGFVTEALQHPTLENSYNIAMNLASREGVDTLDKVVTLMNKFIPNISRDQVIDSIVEMTQTRNKSTNDLMNQLNAIKREAREDKRLQERILDLESYLLEGKVPVTKRVTKPTTAEIAELRARRDDLNKEVAKLRRELGKPGRDAKRLGKQIDALQTRITELDGYLQRGELPPPKTRNVSTPPEILILLRAVRDDLKKQIATSEAAKLGRIKEQIRKLEERILTGDIFPATKVEEIKSKELLHLEYQRDMLREEIRRMIYELKPKSVWYHIARPFHFVRSLKASVDLPIFRQGIFFVLGHPIKTAKAFKIGVSTTLSTEAAYRIQHEILNRDKAPLYKIADLGIRDIGESIRLHKREEVFMTDIPKWLRKIAFWVPASERAYVVTLNLIRADMFDTLVDTLPMGAQATTKELKAIANLVNAGTGLGTLGDYENSAVLLNTAFFAPRYVISRFQLLMGQPFWGGTAATRKIVAKEYARFLIGLGAVYLLASAAGGDVEDDPASSDFGKIKISDKTRLDPLAGISQSTVVTWRFLLGRMKSSVTGKEYPLRGEDRPYSGSTVPEVVGRFLRSKLSPLAGVPLDIFSGETAGYQKVELKKYILSQGVPMIVGDIYTALKEEGLPVTVIAGLLGLMGMGVQTYSRAATKPTRRIGRTSRAKRATR